MPVSSVHEDAQRLSVTWRAIGQAGIAVHVIGWHLPYTTRVQTPVQYTVDDVGITGTL
jgi:hypothetical protein